MAPPTGYPAGQGGPGGMPMYQQMPYQPQQGGMRVSECGWQGGRGGGGDGGKEVGRGRERGMRGRGGVSEGGGEEGGREGERMNI